MIGVEPVGLGSRQQRDLDQILRDRREGDRFEPQHILLGARDALRRDDDEIFDADAEGARLVIAGLVREDHAGVQRLLGPRLSARRSEEHTSELQSLMRISYAVCCLKKKKHIQLQTMDKRMKINKTRTS